MTESERVEWGKAEDAMRKADIAAVKSGTMTLEAAQKAARVRSRKSGMTPAAVHRALCDGQRANRPTEERG